jgi:hypothetical protein
MTLSGDPLLAGWTDTLSLVCGLPGGGQIATIANGWTALTLSNFGQLGAGPGSQLDAGGEGWHGAQDGSNVLYEAALMVASSNGAFADASRGSSFDFAPAAPVTSAITPDGWRASSVFDDSRAAQQVGVTIDQTVTMYAEAESGAYAVVEFEVRNHTGTVIPGAQCGILADIDLPGAGTASERIITLAGNAGFYHENQAGSRIAGVVRLDNSFAVAKYFVNSDGKTAMDGAAKMQALQPGIGTPAASWGDAFAIVATAPADLDPGESLTLALAFVLTETPEQFAAAANEARTRWDLYTGVQDGEDDQSLVPRAFLSQNYPNPFNPETVIAYSLAREGNVRLEIFNLLGQSVIVLADGWNPAGQRTVVWDGTDSGGRQVASGVYFYRLQSGPETISRKMVLMR